MIIYKITHKENGKSYIGQTSQTLGRRVSKHFGCHAQAHDTKFYRAVRKYGRESFEVEQIDSATTQQELDEKEVYWIRYYDTVVNGYNSNDNLGKIGGDTLSNHPKLDEIKEKISKSKMGGKNPNASKVKAYDILEKKVYRFDSIADCVRELGFPNHILISRRCRGEIKSPYKKRWTFEYIE